MNNPLGQHGEFRDRFWLQGSLRYDKGTSQPSLEIVVLTGETLVGFTEKYNATPSKWVLKRWIKKSCEWPNYNIGRKKKKNMEGNILETQRKEKISETKYQSTIHKVKKRGGGGIV